MSNANFKVIQNIVNLNPQCSNQINMFQESSLHTAIENRHDLDIIRFFVNMGLNVNAKNIFGETPLHYAFKYYPTVVPFLMKNGGDLSVRTGCDYTPLDYGNKYNPESVKQTLNFIKKTYKKLKEMLHLGPDRIIVEFLYGLPTNHYIYNKWD